jgi:hypothetical protein
MRVSFFDLENAFEFVSSGGMGQNGAYLCKQTGKIYWRSDYDEDLDELPEDLEESDQYLQIPDKRELGLGKPLVLEFAGECLPNDYDKVRQIFSRQGAYARFRDLLEYRDALKQWYDFEAKATKRALRAWCEENGLEIDETLPDALSEPEPSPPSGRGPK